MQICVKNNAKGSKWFIDSGGLRHMTGDISLFIKLKVKNSGKFKFGDRNWRYW